MRPFKNIRKKHRCKALDAENKAYKQAKRIEYVPETLDTCSMERTFETHHDTITNYFYSRSTNAVAGSFNAKIKNFRRQFRGVTDVKFFHFRLCKNYA
jgi:transposase